MLEEQQTDTPVVEKNAIEKNDAENSTDNQKTDGSQSDLLTAINNATAQNNATTKGQKSTTASDTATKTEQQAPDMSSDVNNNDDLTAGTIISAPEGTSAVQSAPVDATPSTPSEPTQTEPTPAEKQTPTFSSATSVPSQSATPEPAPSTTAHPETAHPETVQKDKGSIMPETEAYPENTAPKSTDNMAQEGYSIVLRDGTETAFDTTRIEAAIKKAFIATNTGDNQRSDAEMQTLSAGLAKDVTVSLTRREQEKAFHLEDIQDQVELALMRGGHYEAAKAYVVYREKRNQGRQAIRTLHSSMGGKVSGMSVEKRDGTIQKVSLDAVTERVINVSDDLKVDPILVSQKAVAGLHDGIKTTAIDEFLSETSASLIPEHPDYSFVASRIKADSLHRETSGFRVATQKLYDDGLLNDDYFKKAMDNMDAIESMIDYKRDMRFDYFGLTTLMKAYLLKVDDKIVERPQDLWMRTALTVTDAEFDVDVVKETYDLISLGYYTHATPTLFNSGLKMQQLSSCFLISMEDDSIDGIFNTLKDTALISKTAGGIGLHAHNIRAQGSPIKSTNGKSNGLIPFLKIFNETARSVDQGGGKRKGSFAVYLEPWHADIEHFLELRKNTGAEEFRARDLFYALWVCDLFMKRVEEDGDWTLMSEYECPRLSDTYGKEFEELYTQYESEGRGVKTMKARALMGKIIEAQIEAGQPYMLYKDSINEKSNQKNVGVIKSSNLCAEIVEYSDENETAVCNLASICLPKFVAKDGASYDYQELYRVAKLATKNLNRVIDINYYPTKKTERSNTRHRPIGLGIQGLADVYFKMKLPYDSEDARDINRKIFETIYFAAMEASQEEAKKSGAYETYQGSPLSEGIFQFDTWDSAQLSEPQDSGLWDWEALRAKIKEHGVRNSLTTACMPTASTGIIQGNTEAFQIQTSNIYKRQTLSGEFMLINRHLVEDLIELGLWNNHMRDQIILHNGSVQAITEIPENLRAVYRTTWEISQKVVIEMAADRQPFIDQTQSMNLWLEKPTFGQVNAMHFYAWKLGLKTGMYYLRSRSAADAVKVTVSSDKKINEQDSNTNNNEPEDCLTCSA